MFSVVSFIPEHVSQIDIHDVYSGDLEVLRLQAPMIYQANNCFTVTLILDGKVAGVVGMAVAWPGVADAWTLLSKAACAHPMELHHCVSKIIRSYTKMLGVVRLSAASRASNAQGQRWLKALGFKPEGLMRKYGPDGSDWYLYARVR